MPELFKQKKFLFGSILALVGVFFLGVFFCRSLGGNFSSLFRKAPANVSSQTEIIEKAIDYINNNILSGGNKASLTGTPSVKNGVYAFKVKIGSRVFDSYVTKDGKMLFPQGIDLAQATQKKPEGQDNNASAGSQQKKMSCSDIKKADNPQLDAFVVSFCPFGLQMQRILAEVVKEIPSLEKNIEVRYIGSISDGKIASMHGEEEANENLRQICLREEQPKAFFPYLSCHIKKGDVDKCLKEAGVNESKLDACQKNPSRGLAYAQKDFDLDREYNISGSPTLVLNGERVSEFDFGGRTAEAVKTLLCCGFKTTPSVCKQKLDSAAAAAGFSESYSKGSSGSGNCN
ncbi:hypothetical protein J7J81_00320 [bacterium]|nr:hypothetical protein [bacterium]